VLTVAIGVTVLYVALCLLALIAAYWFVVPQIWRDQVGHPAALRDYFELAWLTSSLAMIGGHWVRRWNPTRLCAPRRMSSISRTKPTSAKLPDDLLRRFRLLLPSAAETVLKVCSSPICRHRDLPGNPTAALRASAHRLRNNRPGSWTPGTFAPLLDTGENPVFRSQRATWSRGQDDAWGAFTESTCTT
jgi:hypothetical protein